MKSKGLGYIFKSVKSSKISTITIISIVISILFFSTIINAGDIQVDKSAPASNRPQMDKASNEVPVVNIVAPSAGGVSHNKFKEYNVKKQGVILNNSLEVGRSELGGMLYGNPNFQHNKIAADIVLNEVTGVTQTSLAGYTEMFGKPAEFVLANPNGIKVSGGGFINTPRVTLTTGTPQIDHYGDLEGFDIDNGIILINESTLDTTNLDYFSLISRVAKIESAIRAGKELTIKTGRNHYDYKNKSVTPKSDNGAEKPIVAIDSALLGGMYAGRIYLIATEDGVGVNSENGIGANIEDVTITSNGDIVLKKDIAAKQDINIEASGEIIHSGEAIAEANINFTSDQNIEITGSAVSGGVSELKAGDKIINTGVIGASKDISGNEQTEINLKATSIENTGAIESSGAITTESDYLENKENGLIQANGNIAITASNSIKNNKAEIISGANIVLQAAEQITNYVGTIEAQGDIIIEANNFSNIGKDNVNTEDKNITTIGSPSAIEFVGGYLEYKKVGSEGEERWQTMGEYQVTSQLETTPAYLLSGGTINISNAEIENYSSLISAAGDINFFNGKLKNKTAAIKLNIDKKEYQGYYYEDCDSFMGVEYNCRDIHKTRWLSGTAIAQSSNPAIIESQGEINIETAEITNGNSAGFEPISDTKNSAQIENTPVEVAYNTAILEKISEQGIPIQYPPTTTGLQNLNQFYGSDYFLSRIGYKPDRDTKIKIIGDTEYQARAIRQAIFEATAKRYLSDNIITDAEQLRQLTDNAIEANQNLQLSVGVELTPELIAQLEQDIIWYVKQEINGETILVPRVYLSRLTIENLQNPQSAIQAQGNLNINTTGDITNTGKIKSGSALTINAQNITNQTIGNGEQAQITSDGSAEITAQNNITNQSGKITSGDTLTLQTQTGDITNQTTVYTTRGSGYIHSNAGQTGTIQSYGDLTITSGANITNTGADINTGGDAAITAQNNININPATTRNYNATYFKGGHIISDTTKNIGSNINIYGNLAINAENINIIASDITSGADIAINATNNFTLNSAQDTNYFQSAIKKSGFFSSKKTTITKNSSQNIESSITTGGDLTITAQNQNLKITGSSISTQNNAELTAGQNINITAGYDESYYDIQTKKSGILSGGALYSKEKTAQGKGDQTAVNSAIAAQNLQITSGKQTTIKGADITASDISLKTGDNLDITSAPQQSYRYSHSEKTSFGFGGLLGGDFGVLNFENGRLSLTLAKGQYNKNDFRTDAVTQNPTQITAEQNIALNSDKNIKISGSNLNAGQDITLAAKQNINITPTTETTKTNTQTEKGEIELSIGVRHESTQLYYAAKQLEESAQALKKAKQAYDRYKKVLSQAEQDYAAGKLDKQEIETLKDYDTLYKTAIALTTATLAGKTAAMANEIKTASASSVAAGFEFDIQADLDLLISQSKKFQTIAKNTTLTAGQNIKIASQQNTEITGAQIAAGKTIEITAQNTEIKASQDTTNEQTDQKQSHVSYGWGLFGGPDTGGIDGSIAKNAVNTTTYKNARLTGSDITINTEQNTDIKGANLIADNLIINTGANLNVESIQNKYLEYGFSLGGGISFKENKEYGAAANYGQTNGNGAWVNQQTSLYGTNSLTINTGEQTTFTGATANTATGDLTINTGTLNYSDISDRNYKNTIGLQASLTKETTNTGASQTGKEFKATLGISDQLQNTQTAIGAGQITIKNNPNQDLSNLNRNPNTAQTATGKINLDLSIETDTLKAFDPDSYQALKELPQNIAQIGKNITREAADLIDSIKETKDGILNDYIRKTAAREAILKINANPQIKEILENQTKYTPEQILAVTRYIATIISKVRYAEPPDVQYYNGDLLTDKQRLTVNQFGETIDKSQASGFFDPATATIYINAAKTNGTAENLINVIANETSHYIDHTNKIAFDGLYGTREKISDIASQEIESAWTEQFGITPTYTTTAEYQAWLYLNSLYGAYDTGNYQAGLVTEPQPDIIGVHGGFSGTAESVMGILEKLKEYEDYNEEYINSLDFIHSGVLQSTPYYAAKLLSEYTHTDKNLKIVWTHSMGADAGAIAYGNGFTYYNPLSSETSVNTFGKAEPVHELNLVMPRVDILLDNLDNMAKNADTVNIFMLKGDERKIPPQYGDRRFQTLADKLKNKDIPSNVNIIEIENFAGTDPHGGALAKDSPVLEQIFKQYKEIQNRR